MYCNTEEDTVDGTVTPPHLKHLADSFFSVVFQANPLCGPLDQKLEPADEPLVSPSGWRSVWLRHRGGSIWEG